MDTNNKPQKPKVYWDEREEKLVVSEAARLLVQSDMGDETSIKRRGTLLWSLTSGQLVLPANRQKAKGSLSVWLQNKRNIQRLMYQINLENLTKQKSLEPKLPAAETELTIDQLLEQKIAAGIKKGVEEALKVVMAEVNGCMELVLEELQRLRATQPNADKRKKLLIIGLKGQQIREIHQHADERYQVKVLSSQEGEKTIQSNSRNADFIIYMTRFSKHSVPDQIRSVGKDFIACGGSVSELKKCIDELK